MFSFLSLSLFGQELSNIGKSPLFNLNGGLSINQTYNWSDVKETYAKPYAYTLAANLNLMVYGWSVPVSGMYSNRKWSYQQPFNQFSVNPSYKWIRLLIGYNSMSFSSYTLNGHRFFGGGIELTPTAHLKINAMSGKMQERILPDSTGTALPAYKRFGNGLKAEYAFETGNIALSAFYAKDDLKSLDGYDSLSVFPAENLTVALNSNLSLFRNIKLGVEYSTSFYTENTRSETSARYDWLPLFTSRTSTCRYNAMKASLAYTSSIGSFGFGYERVDPGYTTLGAYSTVNDFVNYTFNYAGQIIAEKLNFASSLGFQQDDLDHNKAQKNNQWVGSLNLGFVPVKEVNANINYSNFRYYTHVRSGFEEINNTSPYVYADTLDFTQISENMGLSVSINPRGNENVKSSIILSSNVQLASQQQSDHLNQSDNRFYNGMLGYTHSLLKHDLNISLNFNYNLNKADSVKTITAGPSVAVRKMFLDKKLSTSLALSYNQNRLGNARQSSVAILRSGVGYNFKNHRVDLTFVWAKRKRNSLNQKSNDVTFNLTYSYNFKGFTWTPGKKQKDDHQKNQPNNESN